MMTRLQLVLSGLLPMMLASTSAFACGPSGEEMWILGLFLAPFIAIPYSFFGSLVVASQASHWYGDRRFLRWVGGTVGAFVAATIGCAVGFALASVSHVLDIDSDGLSAVLVFSTPFVFQVAYLMRLHTKRVVRTLS